MAAKHRRSRTIREGNAAPAGGKSNGTLANSSAIDMCDFIGVGGAAEPRRSAWLAFQRISKSDLDVSATSPYARRKVELTAT